MNFHWSCFVGSQLLILVHVTNSLVLLTANVEDIKRIAQKFVSESLADKIADLIMRATSKPNIDVSNENSDNKGDISDEWYNKKPSYNTKRPAKTTQNSVEIFKRKVKDINIRENKKTRYSLQSLRDSNSIISQNPYIEPSFTPKRNPILMSKDFKYKSNLDTIDDVSKDNEKADINYMNSIDEIKNRVYAASTRKVRNEFDQYDNTYYPKAGVVATSGGVSLTKRPGESDIYDNK